MKIEQLAVALIACSGSGKMVSVNAAADQYGYTGSEYTYFGKGIGLSASTTNHYAGTRLMDTNTTITGQVNDGSLTVTKCAQFCQSF